jgi:uncharacterized membrane protein YgcG
VRADHGAMKIITRKRRRAFIESYEFPPALRAKLRERLDNEYQVARALEGLREWFLACQDARDEVLGMPSKAVDVAWHEMILMTRTYHAFCDRAFGRYLHHTPDSLMDEPMRDGLARTLATLDARTAMAGAGVPLLFAVDDEIGLEGGYSWGEEDVAQLRAAQPYHQYAHNGSGHGISDGGSADVGAGCGGGGGGCGGGGCGGGGG